MKQQIFLIIFRFLDTLLNNATVGRLVENNLFGNLIDMNSHSHGKILILQRKIIPSRTITFLTSYLIFVDLKLGNILLKSHFLVSLFIVPGSVYINSGNREAPPPIKFFIEN